MLVHGAARLEGIGNVRCWKRRAYCGRKVVILTGGVRPAMLFVPCGEEAEGTAAVVESAQNQPMMTVQ